MTFARPGGIAGWGWDVWVSTYNTASQQWGPAQNLGPPINTTAVDWSPEISYNGQSFYYMSNGKGHIQGQALYASQWNGTAWGTPQPFPDNINNTATEERPSLTADEKTMYFVRWLVSAGSRPAIHVTEKDSFGVWSNPIVLDSLINTSGGNSGPCITPDGKKLFFGSARSGGVGGPGTADIWVTDRIFIGDLNMDGTISASDVVLEMNKVFLGEDFPAPPEIGDMDCDGQFTPPDAVLILNLTFLGTRPPCN